MRVTASSLACWIFHKVLDFLTDPIILIALGRHWLAVPNLLDVKESLVFHIFMNKVNAYIDRI